MKPFAGGKMNVLIVESQTTLAHLWQRHLQRLGAQTWIAKTQADAVDLLDHVTFDAIVLDVVLERGSAFAVSDIASYRQPNARVVFVTNTSFFSDGSIFRHSPNACAFLPSGTAPSDLASVVEHYAQPH